MVYTDIIYSETLFCVAWWQTTQVTQAHQVQPTGKEVTLQKLQHALLCFHLTVLFLVLSPIHFNRKRIRLTLYIHIINRVKEAIFLLTIWIIYSSNYCNKFLLPPYKYQLLCLDFSTWSVPPSLNAGHKKAPRHYPAHRRSLLGRGAKPSGC